MQTLARFAVAKRWYVIAAWIGFIIAVQALAGAVGGASYKDVFTLPHTETQKVLDLLKANGLQGQTGQTGIVVVHAHTGVLDPAAAPAGLDATLAQLCTAGRHVATVAAPWTSVTCSPTAGAAARVGPGRPGLVSAYRTTAIVNIGWEGNQNAQSNFSGVHDTIKKLATANTEYEFTGGAFQNLANRPGKLPLPELFGLVAALIILGLVFRTVGAAMLPLLSAIAALGSGAGLIALLSHAMNVATFAPELSQLMVIGVGVDYALFIVTRHRRNLMRGMPVADSIALAVNTSGRAVLFAGATVCVAILGLCALGVSFLYGVAVGTSVSVALTMVASLTLLPAVLSLLGYKVLPRKVRSAVRDGSYVDDPHTARWTAWAKLVSTHRIALGALAGLFIVMLAVPFFSLRLGHADDSTDPAGTTTRRGYDLITEKFGKGYNSILELVVDGPSATDQSYLSHVEAELGAVPGVDSASIHSQPLTNRLAFVTFKTTTSPQDARTSSLVPRLRSTLAPRLTAGTSDHIYVFGQTAILVDFAHVVASKMPYFFLAVIGLSFLLLMLAFRSLLVPFTAAAMNLLAAGASFGVVVAIFQWGWLSQLLGIGAGGPIEAFLPVIFFAVLFGLSMDYQVFLVSRMHEEWVHTGDNERAVSVGQAETGGIITAAAVIMIAVFGGFLFGNGRTIKLFGAGLAGAVFLDAFVLRTVLVPAVMHTLGRANWFYPRWLDRITPQVSVEPHDGTWELEHSEDALVG
jgi:RND superfamily putative drug exporter